MAKIKNVSGVDLVVPALGGRLVLAGQVVEVPDGLVYGFTQQSIWDCADEASRAADMEGEADYQGRLAAQTATLEPVEETEPDVAPPSAKRTTRKG